MVLGCCYLKPKTEMRWERALDSALATGHKLTRQTYLGGHRSAWGWPCPCSSSRDVAWSGNQSGKHFRQPPPGTLVRVEHGSKSVPKSGAGMGGLWDGGVY